MNIYEIVSVAFDRKASDIHVGEKGKVFIRIDNEIVPFLNAGELENYPDCLKNLVPAELSEQFARGEDADFAITTPQGFRCRVNLFRQQGEICCVLRLLSSTIPHIDQLGLPEVLKKLAMLPRGLVLFTGPTGSGKSTSLAAIIDYANEHRKSHIITVEDPLEYLHKNKNSIISQREIGKDVPSFSAALRSAMREDPDIILVGEMRDHETISAAITAAETGHLVFSTLHTTGAAKSVDRIIDAFPPHQQTQVRSQLSGVLRAVVTQQLAKKVRGGRAPAFEIMLVNDAIAAHIREGKTHQINSSISTGAREGMCTLDQSLAELVKNDKVSMEEASLLALKPQDFQRFVAF